MKLAITSFSGEIPRIEARLLATTNAQIANGVKLEDGSMLPMRQAREVESLGSSPQTIYLNGDDWLTWPGIVSVAPAPIAENRLYVTDDGAPKIIAGAVTYELAVPAPSGALTASISSTPDPELSQTVLYTYTWVTELDEESEPAPLSAGLVWSEGIDVLLSGFALPPGGRGIDRQRIYRSQISALGETLLYLIAEQSVSASDWTDVVADNPIQELLPSLEYNPPPSGLSGLIAMPNGMMAAFVGKRLYFCEPWRPHAWPEKYILTTDYEIVGLGAFGSSLAVMTTGQPYIVTGTAPDTMSMEKLEVNLPCLARRGIVDLGYSIAYPSPDGLVIINTSGAQLASGSIMTRDQWQALNPSSFVASCFAGRYIMSYTPSAGPAGTIIVDMTGEQRFITHAPDVASAMFSEIGTGALFYVSGDTIREWEAQGQEPHLFTWRSKKFVLEGYKNFGALLAYADPSYGGSAPNFAVNIYADETLLHSTGVMNEVTRLPAGRRARIWEIEIVTNCRVHQVAIANSPSEFVS